MREFSEGAHWLGTPVDEMSADLLLRYCYMEMDVNQARAVAARMKDVPVPTEPKLMPHGQGLSLSITKT
jgi:hypothetical protein